jgi:N-acyl-L-homoserine lactone synthetase
MRNQSVFTVDIYTGNLVPPALLKQFGRLRYDCFDVNDPYVLMNHQDKTELDGFDRLPTTLHLMVTSKQPRQAKKLVSAVRLIPTTEEYDLEQPSWSYLTDRVQLPKAGNIVEGSRWVGKSSRTYEGTISTALLMLQLYQLSRDKGFDQLIGVIAAKSETWLNKRQAGNLSSASRYSTERDGEILVTTINLDQQFLNSARQLMLQSMEFWSVSQIAVAARVG